MSQRMSVSLVIEAVDRATSKLSSIARKAAALQSAAIRTAISNATATAKSTISIGAEIAKASAVSTSGQVAGIAAAAAAMTKYGDASRKTSHILESQKRIVVRMPIAHDAYSSIGDVRRSIKVPLPQIVNPFDASGFGAQLRKGLPTIAGTIATAKAVGIGALVAGFAGKKLFVDDILQAEKLAFVLKNLANQDMKLVADWKKRLTQMDDASAFGIAELTQAFATLKIAGMDPLDGSLQSLADALAATGKGSFELERATVQIGQAFRKNNLLAEDMKPLLEMQIDLMGALSRAMPEKTREDLEAMDFKGFGQQAILIALRQIGKESQGAAEAYSRSLNGMIDKTMGLKRKFSEAIGSSGFSDALSRVFGKFISFVETKIASGEFEAAAKRIGKNLSDLVTVLEYALPKIANLFGAVYEIVDRIGDKIGGITNAIGGIAGAALGLKIVAPAAAAAAVGNPLAGVAVGAAGAAVGFLGGAGAVEMLRPNETKGEVTIKVEDDRVRISSVKQRGNAFRVVPAGHWGVSL